MIQPGSKLAHYEIVGALGKGGMGEVWRARDTKLGREVAIKTLPAEFAADADRLARFEREAKLLASLNHPNIAAIHGIEEHAGSRFLVMEIVEGDTLADKLQRGAIPVAESLKLALQIAEALEAAHDKGVVHRDLKPANIKVTPEGRVKVLDFGLAKAPTSDTADVSLSNSPTLSIAATQAGVVLGTAPYMSPEQAKGREVDRRTDLWALGAVLYEMLTGRQAFQGGEISEVFASVLAREPDYSLLHPRLNPRILAFIHRCLQKDPGQRWQAAGDVRIEIAQVLADPASMVVQSVDSPPRSAGRFKVAWVVVSVLGLLVAGYVGWHSRPDAPLAVYRFSHVLPEGQNFPQTRSSVAALSPDGSMLVYPANGQLYIRPMDALESRPIPGTNESPTYPFFSPDGQWIGYWSSEDGQLKKIPVGGGVSLELASIGNPLGTPRWGTDGTIVLSQGSIVRVSEDGGEPEPLIDSPVNIGSPQALPDGESFVFSVGTATEGEVMVQSIGGEPKPLFPGTTPTYVSTGHLLYHVGGVLYAVPFDLDALEPAGNPVSTGMLLSPPYAVSESGTLAYEPGTGSPPDTSLGAMTLVWVDREGNEDPIQIRPDDYSTARVSPDGTRVALVLGSILGRGGDIWVFDLVTENLYQLTFHPARDDGPVWSSDSSRIFFRSFRSGDGLAGVYSIPAEGGDAELLAAGSADYPNALPWSMLPDGQTLALVNAATLDEISLATFPLDGSGEFRMLLNESPVENEPVIAPGGAWMAYQEESSSDSQPQINLRPFPDVTRLRRPLGPGSHPLFSADGSELYYFDGTGIVAIPIEYEPDFRFGAPQLLFREEYRYGVGGLSGALGRAWDADPSGDRFLMIKAVTDDEDAQASVPRIHIVANWFEELKELVPVP